jgi:hypothetical protein
LPSSAIANEPQAGSIAQIAPSMLALLDLILSSPLNFIISAEPEKSGSFPPFVQQAPCHGCREKKIGSSGNSRSGTNKPEIASKLDFWEYCEVLNGTNCAECWEICLLDCFARERSSPALRKFLNNSGNPKFLPSAGDQNLHHVLQENVRHM